jgi:hypothetical protein
MGLKAYKQRIRRLEQRSSYSMSVQAIFLDVPHSPPLMLVDGEWLRCDDPNSVLAKFPNAKVYAGIDPAWL